MNKKPELRYPIGISDFSTLVSESGTPDAYNFVDKTWLIRDFIAAGRGYRPGATRSSHRSVSIGGNVPRPYVPRLHEVV